jgi:DNA-binding GntR family transcriptional regulator
MADTPPLVEQAFQRLRKDVLIGAYPAGAKLKVDELQEAYGFSSSPLREALSRLAGQGLVQSMENRGFRVAPLSVEGIADLTRVRLLIELETLSDAIDHGNDAWESECVAAAHRLALSEQRLTNGGTVLDDDWSARHRAFHMAIYSGASSSLLRGMVSDLFDAAERYRRFSAQHRMIKRNKNDEHQEILRVTLSRDKPKALGLLAQHISSTERNVTAAFLSAGVRSAQ